MASPLRFLSGLLALSAAYAQSSSQASFTFASTYSVSTITDASVSIPTGPYQSYASQRTASIGSLGTTGTVATSNSTANATMTTASASPSSSTSNSLLLVGSPTSTANGTTTASSAAPTNTQPCNNYPELCDRAYMNFTEVCAHNSAFDIPNNAASNQEIDIIGQLNDGVRMIQGETHYVNDTIYCCHTSCDLLNAGTLQNELTTVRTWIEANPYDVVTVLLVNSDFRNVTDYVDPILNSGLGPYLYEPPKVPMNYGDWPTLGQMILSGKRVVIFMDYQANQTEVPYVLDEFSQMWETPFSPTNISFPCSQQRPPGLNSVQQNIVPYLANHNLNVKVTLGSTSILIPDFTSLDQVNSVNGTGNNTATGSLGLMADQCNQTWGRPPAWLLVDFYNDGNFPGSVFEVAARMNGLNYSRSCCGKDTSVSSGASNQGPSSVFAAALLALSATVCAWGLL